MLYFNIALFGIKYWKQLLIVIFSLFILLFMTLFSAIPQPQTQQQYQFGGGAAKVSDAVLRYLPTITTYAEKYGVESYIPILLAKMMQESGGLLPDVMQSSESLGLPRNTIVDPVYSINVGVKYFAEMIKKAGGDVELALQSYNFGEGFIAYAKSRGGYSKEVAIEFSNMMAAKQGWDRYGDVNYVDNVMRYVDTTTPVNTSPMGDVKGVNYFNNLLQVARQYEGMVYSWGGATPATSFDCSGLWQWSFKQIGINVPRTAQEQYNYTKRISKEQLQAGDFVFFTGTGNHAYISHVGIYIGNGNMYNAAKSTGVSYASIDSGYWSKHIAGYGRLN